MTDGLLPILYLIASVTFILGIKLLGSPKTARVGNLTAAAGMVLAIVGTIFLYRHNGQPLHNVTWILAALALGTAIGWVMAMRVKMTAMPQMVSFFNGMGGACAALISILEYKTAMAEGLATSTGHSLATMAGLIIGAVSFSGSIIAYLKLEDRLGDIRFGGQQLVNNGLLVATVVVGGALVVGSLSGISTLYLLTAMALIFGILFVLPIGGADMPVVISLLNSFTGVAAACGGFLYDNMVMLIGGILVGSAGTILTVVMCNSMNRSLLNVLIGNFGGASGSSSGGSSGGSYREVSAADAAMMMTYAKQVVIVPGYGLAVAQAQHVCHQLEHELEGKGVTVKYAIHPVAGRMPGHMNVLLAEADVAYDKLVEMEEVNAEFPTTDVVLVVGANDVVNPAAKTDPTSPIYGMPILDAELAHQVIIMKRSMKAGYAGIDNELFYRPNAAMLFGDAKASLTALVNEVKQV
ncbi:MAG: NAD(P)(+) transhydrogenase (Re/Si-specific) subunit beta [Bacteroidota bacterium]|jgi:NAD(P) transhydrogenase subunit beta